MTTGPASSPPPRDARSRARPELLWYLRHAEALARWPVLDEPWARRVEGRRAGPGSARGADPPGARAPSP